MPSWWCTDFVSFTCITAAAPLPHDPCWPLSFNSPCMLVVCDYSRFWTEQKLCESRPSYWSQNKMCFLTYCSLGLNVFLSLNSMSSKKCWNPAELKCRLCLIHRDSCVFAWWRRELRFCQTFEDCHCRLTKGRLMVEYRGHVQPGAVKLVHWRH